MAKILTAMNAEILTASVTIKSLTVERKQVTLAVFRQLMIEHIFDFYKPGLNGVGWGHVRYLIEADPEDAIHLVWQKGTELRRCIVTKSPPRCVRRSTGDSYDYSSYRHRTSLFHHGGKTYYTNYKTDYLEWGERTYYPDIAELNVEAVCGPAPTTKTYDHVYLEWQRKCIEAIKKYQAQCEVGIANGEKLIAAAQRQYRVMVAPLFDLPQLFIAV